MSRRAASELPPLSMAMHQAWDELRADYHAGTTGRFRPTLTGVSPMGSGADYHYRSESHFLRMIERARHFDRNEPVISSGLDRLTTSVIGQDGFTLDVKTGDPAIDEELGGEKGRWYEWADDPDQCDYEGEKTFGDMEWLALRSMPADGDMASLLLHSGKIQNVEAHRIRTPQRTEQNVFCGVKFDPVSKQRLQFWITKEDVDPLRPVTHVRDVQKVDVRDASGFRQVLHLYFPKRFSQTRGITATAPPVDYIGVHGDLQYATLVKAQIAACYSILETVHPDADERPALSDDPAAATGAKREQQEEDGTTSTLMGIYPGARIRAPRGVQLQGFAPNIPCPEFFPHAFLILTFIAISLDIPIHVLLLDASKTNFSGWRGAIDEARKKFRVWQRLLIRRFHTPIYRWKVRQWMAKDLALAKAAGKSGIDIFGHQWNPPTWQYIEPNKDVEADTKRMARNLISYRRRAAEQGLQGDELRRECLEDRKTTILMAMDIVNEIKQKHPDKNVVWEQVAGEEYMESKISTAMVAAQARKEQAAKKEKTADASDSETAESSELEVTSV